MMDPPLMCICVATGVDTPEAGGEFSPGVVSSGIAASIVGETCPDCFLNPPPLSALPTSIPTSFSEIWERGLRVDPPDLRFRVLDRGVVGDVWTISVGVVVVVTLGVCGKSFPMKLRRGGKLMRKLNTDGGLLGSWFLP